MWASFHAALPADVPYYNLSPVHSLPHHLLTEVVQRVNEMIATGQYGRLFAVVHLASKQWKVTSEDLILMENVLPAECGDRIRLEKVKSLPASRITCSNLEMSLPQCQ